MKITILNGSARVGNTYNAIEAFSKGASKNNEVEIIKTDELKLDFCKGCGACMCHKGCVCNDDTNYITEKLVNSDLIVFATPVYWWGMSSQLKLVIDKCYSRGIQLKNKKIGLIICGGSSLTNRQYSLIKEQFELMAEYLNWNFVFYKPFYANKCDDLANDNEAISSLIELGNSL